jgi:MFS family permease
VVPQKSPPEGAWSALAGFLLSGFLIALLGAVLPAWGYHRDPPDFVAVGSYFLALAAGILLSVWLVERVLRRGLAFVLVLASSLACASLAYLAVVSPPVSCWWRVAGLLVLGMAVGWLNTGLFHALTAAYQSAPAAVVNKGGIFYSLGCLAAALLVAGTFYAYTVPSILIFMAAVPGFYAVFYSRRHFVDLDPGCHPTLRQALRDFRSPAAVLFSLLLFFQFGNEWSIAGWLPLFLIRRVGLSPSAALLLLALYCLALLGGRLAAVAILPRVRHGRLLGMSVLSALFGCLILYLTDNAFGAATATLLVGGGFATIYPLVLEKIGHRFPYYHPGFFNGIFSFAIIGGTLAPATLGYAAHFMGVGVVMAIPLLGTCMVLVLLLLLWLEAKVTGR